MKKTLCKNIFLLVTFNLLSLTICSQKLRDWYQNVKSVSYKCKQETNFDLKDSVPLLQVVNCEEKDAIYNYEIKATGGKKLKKGPFNGLLTIKLPINTDSQLKSHGLCSGKCLKISSNRLKFISGHFDNDVLQGEATITFDDNTFTKGYFERGIQLGVTRHFDENGILLNITDFRSDNKSSIRTILKSWIQSAQDPNFAWHHYTTDYDPIDKNNPELDITFDIIKNNPNFKSLNLIIETSSGEGLFRGKMINGRLKAKIDSKLMDHPGWRTRLKIKVINLNLHGSEVIMDQVESDMYYKATLKDGKIHGIVQAYGIVTRDPEGPCADGIEQGLAFIAKYDEGKPIGATWRQLIGGAWLYGNLNQNGAFSGEKLAYLYQDLELAIVGEFKDGLLVNGQEANVIKASSNEFGIMELEFSEPRGPVYHYLKATNETFGDQPHLRDPLDKKYLYLKNSEEYPLAGEGTFATMDVPKHTVFSLYGGLVFLQREQAKILKNSLTIFKNENNLAIDDPKLTDFWKNWQGLQCAGAGGSKHQIDVPPEFDQASEYQGTLGHKVNHHFSLKGAYLQYDSPRHGLIRAVKTLVDVKKDQEYFSHYAYEFETFGQLPWYRNLFIKTLMESNEIDEEEKKDLLKDIQLVVDQTKENDAKGVYERLTE